jgi:hypothetical protein
MAMVIEEVIVKAVEANKVEEVAIKARANIKVEDVVIELKKEEVTIALIIGYYY